MSERRSRPRALPRALVLVLATFFCVTLAGTAQAAQRGGPVVDPALRSALAESDRVAAVVTARSRGDLAAVDRLGVRGTKLRVLPMILTDGLTAGQLARLERSPAVRSVYANEPLRLLMEDTTWIVGARYVWDLAGGAGVTGAGVDVAVIDTGADGLHEDLDNLVEFCETQQATSADRTTVLCSPFDPASGNAGPAGATNTARGDATDDNGHGTHVSGTIAGSGDGSGGREATHSTIGIAPDARLHVYSANVGPALLPHEILAAYDDLVYKKVNGLNEVVAVSNSWGGGSGASYDPADPIHVAIEAAYDAGILSVFAAGNSGPEHDTLSRQCVSPWVVCVGATTKPDAVVMFSSRGRPSEPADTNRDGVVGGEGDVEPDNHDRELGQALGLGLYRPALAAPGVNIFSAEANEVACREGPTPDSSCYVAFNGTSMATPHVSGAVALIVEAFRAAHGGRTPTPEIVTDILERSANVSKLPDYESEEQGAGRLDVRAAVDLARGYPDGLPEPAFGAPTPPYESGRHPGAAATISSERGCTGTLSWTASDVNPLDLVGQPPLATERFGQHVIDVPANVERLRVTVSWPRHPSGNLYVRLWRPGVDPDGEQEAAGQTRVFADQEALGLLTVTDRRWLDIRAPEGSTLDEGPWILRVYHRAGGVAAACDLDSSERPKQAEGFNYTVDIERPGVSEAPTAAITSPADGATVGGRFVELEGTASYPEPWDGVTNYEVPGSGTPTTVDPDAPDTRLALHFHGNAEEGCTGDGATDVAACDGPFLLEEATLSAATAASWKVADPLFNGAADRNVHDPNWVWRVDGRTTVSGAMTVEWWGSCGACDADIGISADWRIRLWADGTKVFEQRITATPSAPNVAERLEVTVDVPTATAEESFVLHVDPVYIDSQVNSRVYYDSAQPCPTAPGSEACASLVRMPVGEPDAEGDGLAAVEALRVTDAQTALRVAWDGVEGASKYEIHRSTEPAFVATNKTRIANTAGERCDSPDVPSWPTASRSGLCYTDKKVAERTTYYYRVVARDGNVRGDASELAYGAPTRFDRKVKVEVDRLYGPQYWEYAELVDAAGTSWRFVWDTLELAGEHAAAARSFTQAAGSSEDRISLVLAR